MMSYFPFATFNIFSLFLFFDWLWWILMWISLILLWVYWSSRMCKLMCPSNLGSSKSLFLQILFSPLSKKDSFSCEIFIMCLLVCLMVLHRSLWFYSLIFHSVTQIRSSISWLLTSYMAIVHFSKSGSHISIVLSAKRQMSFGFHQCFH